jgi:rubrerythrin
MGTEPRWSGLSTRRRDLCRVVVVVVFALVASVFCAFGCGSGGQGAATDSEKAADVEVVNATLAVELTAIDAYTRGMALLHGPTAAVGREFRGQDQEHVDALTKAIRGLGGEVEAEASEIEGPGPKSQAEALRLAYEEENAALAYYLDAERRLQTTAPRALAASIAASHAQHLVVLRQELGAALPAAAPEAFEPGDLPPPGEGG